MPLLPTRYSATIFPGDADFRSLDVLHPDFRDRCSRLIKNCSMRGITMVPYFTVRGPQRQGQLWCQSRSAAEILGQVSLLRTAGATILASYLDPKLASTGRWATAALPGQSWHQWGMAMDCYNEVSGRAVWMGSGYRIYAEEAVRLGLDAGANWAVQRDPNHVQLTPIRNTMMVEGSTFSELEQKLSKIYSMEPAA